MKSLILTRFARKPSLLSSPLPTLDITQPLLIKMKYAPVNPSDYHFSLGVYGQQKVVLPAGLGFEGVGQVVDVHPSQSQGLLNKHVALFIQPSPLPLNCFPQGTYSEYIKMSVDQVIELDRGEDDYLKQMSQCIVNPATSLALLQMAASQPHPVIMHNAAYSFLGRTLITQAKHKHIHTISLVRQSHQIQPLKQLGADYVLNTTDDTFTQQLEQVLNQTQCSLFIDSIGGEDAAGQFNHMQNGSNLISIGVMSQQRIPVDPKQLIFMDKTIKGFSLFRWIQKQNQSVLKKELQMVLREQVAFDVLKVVALEEGREVFSHYRQEKRVGKILIEL